MGTKREIYLTISLYTISISRNETKQCVIKEMVGLWRHVMYFVSKSVTVY